MKCMMNKRRPMLTKALTAVVAISMSGMTAMAGTDTSNMAVSASVSNNCVISAAAMSFGSYDPISTNATTPLDASADLTVQCTNGATAAVTLSEGMNPTGSSTASAPQRQLSDGTDNLTYNLYSDSGHSSVWNNDTGEAHSGDGTATTMTVYGRVDAGQTSAAAGSYADTVVATVTF